MHKVKQYIIALANWNLILTNPFFLYVLSFAVALILYSFHWIDYPGISLELGLFIGSSLGIAILIGAKTINKSDLIIPTFNQKKLFRFSLIWMAVVLTGFIITFIHSGTLLEKMVLGQDAVNYKTDYGTIRYLTRFIKVANAVGSIFFLHFYFSFQKRKYLLLVFICLIPIVLLFNRFYAFNVIVPLVMVVFFHIKIRGYKFWSTVIVFFLILSFVFGIVGNIREEAKKDDDSELFEQLAGPNYPTWLNKDFIWVYFYISSPIAKLEYTVSDVQLIESPKDFKGLATHALLPASLGVRMNRYLKSESRFSENGYPPYYVGTSYHDAFCYAHWMGMIIMLCLIFIPVMLYMTFYLNNKNYWTSIPTIAVLNMMFVLIPFGNILVMTTTNSILYISIVCGIFLYRFSTKSRVVKITQKSLFRC